jgi:hypothetical protein
LFFGSNTTISSDKNGGGGAYTYNMASAISVNVWHYFIYNSNSDGTTAVYIDGVRSINTQVDTYNYTTATDTIGRYYGGYWPGYWTNMRITIGTAVYNSNLTTQLNPKAPLTSLPNTKYLMLGASVTTDSSGIQTVTNNNGVTLSVLQPCPGPTPTPTVTATNTVTPTNTPTNTTTSTQTPTNTASNTQTPSNTATNTQTPTQTPTNTQTPTTTTTLTATNTETPTNTQTPSNTPTNTQTPTTTTTLTATPTETPTNTATNTQTPTNTTTNTQTPTTTPTTTPTNTETPTQTQTPTKTGATLTPTTTPTTTPTPTRQPTPIFYLDASTVSGGTTTWTDSVAGIPFTLYGNGRTSPNQSTYPTYNSGYGGYLSFNSSNRQFARASASLGSQTTFTVTGWWWITSLDTVQGNTAFTIITERLGGSPAAINFALGYGVNTQTNTINGGLFKGGWASAGSAAPTTGAWQYLALTYNNSTATLQSYINGAVNGPSYSVPSGQQNPITSNIGYFVGTRWDATAQDTSINYLNGRVATIKVYNQAFGSSQILSMYNAELSRFLEPTPTPTATPTQTGTPSVTSTQTPTNTKTPTETPTNTPTNTETPTETPTNTPTNTETPTNTPTNTETPTNTPTNTTTNTETPTQTQTPTNTETPTVTPTETPTPEPTTTPTNTETPTPTQSVPSCDITYNVVPFDMTCDITYNII